MNAFLVISFGYWGRGPSVREAAQNALKSGACLRDPVVVYAFPRTPVESVSVDSNGWINFPHEIAGREFNFPVRSLGALLPKGGSK